MLECCSSHIKIPPTSREGSYLRLFPQNAPDMSSSNSTRKHRRDKEKTATAGSSGLHLVHYFGFLRYKTRPVPPFWRVSPVLRQPHCQTLWHETGSRPPARTHHASIAEDALWPLNVQPSSMNLARALRLELMSRSSLKTNDLCHLRLETVLFFFFFETNEQRSAQYNVTRKIRRTKDNER